MSDSMNHLEGRFAVSPKVRRWTLILAAAWGIACADWIWFGKGELPLRFLEIARVALRWTIFAATIPAGILWLKWSLAGARRKTVALPATLSVVFVPWYQLALISADAAGMDMLRAQVAQAGTFVMYLLGLGWGMYWLEKAARKFDRERTIRRLERRAVPAVATGRLNWNPIDPDAWYYRMAATDWFSPKRFRQAVRELRENPDLEYGRDRRKLNQSLMGLCGYTLAFWLSLLLMTQVGGCSEIYEMPAGGGGPQTTIVQQVKVQKVIKKKYVINPFSAIRFKVPPIDEVKLQLTELTQHLYQIGQGAGGMGYGTGDGSGFYGGTGRGKVRFIRLQYTGGDWDQDFGVGADLNMLLQYGIRTQQKVSNETEARTIQELSGFKKGNSPPFVFMTGQKNISLAANEVKILRDYLTDKHGMLFCDNGGSAHFHNQFFAMMNQVLPDVRPVQIPLDDIIHKSPFQIPFLPYVAPHGGREAWGWKIDGRWVAYYHPGDIGDAWSDGHSGVKPEVWEACYQLGTNVIFYAHMEYAKWLEAQNQQNKGK